MNAPQTLPSAETALAAIRAALAGPMAWPKMDQFTPEARLGSDLGLDSVALLTLVLALEEAGIKMPEAAFDQAPGLTVRALADLLAGIAPVAEEPVDIKVHCVVSCLCQAVKDAGGIDHRPLYLGLWDGQVVVDDRARLSYHAVGIDHGFYLHWAERLFGLKVTRWYDDGATKAENLARLQGLLAAWRPAISSCRWWICSCCHSATTSSPKTRSRIMRWCSRARTRRIGRCATRITAGRGSCLLPT